MESDRTWPLPLYAHVMRMEWHDLLFAHWSFEPERVSRLLPQGIRLDTFEGRAWVGVVPFRMADVAPRGLPAIPGFSAFPEINVRTYVTSQGKPGVWFFSLDAQNRLAVRVARWFFHLNYRDARMALEQTEAGYRFRSVRSDRRSAGAEFKATYRPHGEVFSAQPGTLEYWLTARYCLYTVDRRARILRAEIDHKPWPLQQAELHIMRNTMLDWLSLECGEAPHLLFSKSLAVQAWSNERVS